MLENVNNENRQVKIETIGKNNIHMMWCILEE